MSTRKDVVALSIVLGLWTTACGNTDFSGGGGLASGKSKAKDDKTETTGAGGPGTSTATTTGTGDGPVGDDGGANGEGPGGDGGQGTGMQQTDGTSSTDAALKECALAVGGQPVDVVTVTGTGAPLDLKPDSVVFLEARGQADINLSPQDIAAIKGLCIWANGGAAIKLDTSLTVAGMYYYGRGNAETKISFGATGDLSKLVVDIAGGNRLVVDGTKIECAALQLDGQTGSSKVTCNGTPL